jgi:hypothetical protein
MKTGPFFLSCVLYAVSATGEISTGDAQPRVDVVHPSTQELKGELLSTIDAKFTEFSAKFDALRTEFVAGLQAVQTSDDSALSKDDVNELIEGYLKGKLSTAVSRDELAIKELTLMDKISQARTDAAFQSRETKKECRKIVTETVTGMNFEEVEQNIAARLSDDINKQVRESISEEIAQNVAAALAKESKEVRGLVDAAVEANNAKVTRLVESSIDALSARAQKNEVSRTELAELRIDIARLRVREKDLTDTLNRVEKETLAYYARRLSDTYLTPALAFAGEVLDVYRDGFVYLYYDFLQVDKVFDDLTNPEKGGVLQNVVNPDFWKNSAVMLADALSSAKREFDNSYWPQLQRDTENTVNVVVTFAMNLRETCRASVVYKMLRYNTRTLSSKYAGFCLDENLTEEQQEYVYDGIFVVICQIIVVLSWSIFSQFCDLLCPRKSSKVADGSQVAKKAGKEKVKELRTEQ